VLHDTGEAVFHAQASMDWFDHRTLLDSQAVWRVFEQHPTIPSPRAVIEAAATGRHHPKACLRALVRAYRLLVREAGKRVAYTWVSWLFAGRTPDQVRAFALATLIDQAAQPLTTWRLPGGPGRKPILVRDGIRPYAPMTRLVHDLEAAGLAVWIVTASAQPVAEAYAQRFLGLPPGRVIGVRPRIVDGRYTAAQDPDLPLTYAAGKVAAIEQLIGGRPRLAAGDTLSQHDMLYAATDLALVIHKGDRDLLARVASHRRAGDDRWLVQPRFIDPSGVW